MSRVFALLLLPSRLQALLAALCLVACLPKIDLTGPYGIGTPPSPRTAEPDHIRFIAVGDFGERLDQDNYKAQGFPEGERRRRPHPAQSYIAKSAQKICAGECDFVVLLGDNVYPVGIGVGKSGEEDKAMLRAAVDGYGTPDSYFVLGNHDWHPVFPSLKRARRELDFVAGVDGWHGSHFFSFDAGPARVIGLDSNYLVRRGKETQDRDLNQWMAEEIGYDGWKIALGHHPLRSNGHHRNVGGYTERGFKFWPGREYAEWVDRFVVGKVDLYLAGHSHTLEFYELAAAEGTTAAVVSGSAGECGPPPDAPVNPATSGDTPRYERWGYGFTLVDATPERLEVSFHGVDGERLWHATRTRGSDAWEYPDGVKTDFVFRCQDDADHMIEVQRERGEIP
jgi:hypothetical protein